MIEIFLLTVALNTAELKATPVEEPKITANRKRSKKSKGRRKGGWGLR